MRAKDALAQHTGRVAEHLRHRFRSPLSALKWPLQLWVRQSSALASRQVSLLTKREARPRLEAGKKRNSGGIGKKSRAFYDSCSFVRDVAKVTDDTRDPNEMDPPVPLS